MSSPQLSDGYVRISNEIWDEIIRRDFSKRQKDILQFILRLSYGCNRKVAHIPLLRDFSLCGVTPNHIAEELKYLMTCKVIDWHREDMLFAFNKNYEIWQVSPVKKWDDERFKDLVHINLTSQNGNFPKQELPEKGSLDLPKREVEEGSNPCGSRAEDVSKDSIKEVVEEDSIHTVFTKVYNVVSMPPLFQEFVVKLMNEGYTETYIKELFLYVGKMAQRPNLDYTEKVHADWKVKNIYSRYQAELHRKKGQPREEREAEIQSRLAEERKTMTPLSFEPEDVLKEAVG